MLNSRTKASNRPRGYRMLPRVQRQTCSRERRSALRLHAGHIVLQAVHMMLGGESHGIRGVFIGRKLDRRALLATLSPCIASPARSAYWPLAG